MDDNKSQNWKFYEKFFLFMIIFFIIIHSLLRNDSLIATISAVCGITYTFIAGKGNPICYLFGITGSFFYSLLSFQNALWGNLSLYLLYYIPMQITGFINWNKNLKENRNEIIKISLPKNELIILILLSVFLIIFLLNILNYFQDTHPLLDSITTVLSIGGMYLTVRRALEQWIFWMVVNLLSLTMWMEVAMTGARVYSTVVMWSVYFILAIYFYIDWKKELKSLH